MGKESQIKLIKILEAASGGFEIMYEIRSHQRVAILESADGIRRIIAAKNRKKELARIRLLKQRKIIKIEKVGNKTQYLLTKRGNIKRLNIIIATAKTHPEGAHTYIMFDIPEQFRDLRRLLNTLLKNSGFIHIQKSIWKTPKDVTIPLKEWVKLQNLNKWILILKAEET